ncbi:hypothetical protein HYQ46_009553 [Verticillium longisporum]|nr:hypothetical protein HYQ46_009553 [Verticillium longisporum]
MSRSRFNVQEKTRQGKAGKESVRERGATIKPIQVQSRPAHTRTTWEPRTRTSTNFSTKPRPGKIEGLRDPSCHSGWLQT